MESDYQIRIDNWLKPKGISAQRGANILLTYGIQISRYIIVLFILNLKLFTIINC